MNDEQDERVGDSGCVEILFWVLAILILCAIAIGAGGDIVCRSAACG